MKICPIDQQCRLGGLAGCNTLLRQQVGAHAADEVAIAAIVRKQCRAVASSRKAITRRGFGARLIQQEWRWRAPATGR